MLTTVTEADLAVISDPTLAEALAHWRQHGLFAIFPPKALMVDGKPAVIVFSQRYKRTELCQWIVTAPGHRGQGHGRAAWSAMVGEAYAAGMRRLWMLATPASVSWHAANGLTFIGCVWKTGCLITEGRLFPTIEAQRAFREDVLASEDFSRLRISDQTMARVLAEPPVDLPDPVKQATAMAIEAAGKFYVRDRIVAICGSRGTG